MTGAPDTFWAWLNRAPTSLIASNLSDRPDYQVFTWLVGTRHFRFSLTAHRPHCDSALP